MNGFHSPLAMLLDDPRLECFFMLDDGFEVEGRSVTVLTFPPLLLELSLLPLLCELYVWSLILVVVVGRGTATSAAAIGGGTN